MKTQRFTRAGYLFLALLLPLALTVGRPALPDPAAGPEKAASLPALAQGPISALIGADQSVYHARLDGAHFRMDNPDQGLSTEFSADGMQVSAGVHSWGLTLEGYGYGESLQPLPDVDPTARDNRLEYARGPLTEWYLNGPFGLEQGFTLDSPPAVITGGPLTLALSQAGDLQAAVGADGKELVLTAASGEAVLRYAGLAAYDADGLELQTWLETRPGVNGRPPLLLLRLDDLAARYPLTVDPFVQKAKLTASDKAIDDEFGYSIAISGNVVVVGAPFYDPGGRIDTGAAYVFVKPSGGWGNITQTTKLTATDQESEDRFGISVAISGNVVVVGKYLDDYSRGSAYVFVKPFSGWSACPLVSGIKECKQSAKLTASDRASKDYFGGFVAISGDVVVVGAGGDDNYRGAAYVFVKPGGGWKNMTETAKLTSSVRALVDYFGSSVAISSDVIVVGAPLSDPGGTTNAGAAYVFVKPAGGWGDMTETSKLTASDKIVADEFGFSVAISSDVVIVGAGGDDNYTGAAYVFVKPGVGWENMTETAKLTSTDRVAGDWFGASISISGDVVVVGAYGANLGGKTDAGAAYVFVKPDGGWAACPLVSSIRECKQTAKLTASGGASADIFGISVSIDGGYISIGARYADPGGTTDAGAAYVFENTINQAKWTFMVYLDGDNSLEKYAINDFMEMSSVGSNNDLKIVVQFDRSVGRDSRYDDWKDTRRFLVTKGITPTAANGTSIGESNMGDPQTLIDFVEWGILNYPAEHYALVIYNHGNGWFPDVLTNKDINKSVACDDYPEDNCLTMGELRDAMQSITTINDSQPLDLVGFDACLMGMIEVDNQLKPYVNVRVGSEENSPKGAWSFNTILAALKNNPTSTPEQLGEIMVDKYYASSPFYNTMSAVSLTDPYTTLNTAVNNFAMALDFGGINQTSEIIQARSKTQHFDIFMNNFNNYIDLYDFAYQVNQTVSATNIRTAATNLMNSIDAAVLNNKAGSSWPGAHGISIYFPKTLSRYDKRYDSEGLQFTEETWWDEWLHAYYHYADYIKSSFRSQGAYDGWVLESSETSNAGDIFNDDQSTIRLGDDNKDRQYRSILSFNTADLPDNAVIKSVVIKIKKMSLIGTDPFSTHIPLKADIKNPYFGSRVGLEALDFQAGADKEIAGEFWTTPISDWYTAHIERAAFRYINLTGTTQFRLRFVLDDDNDDLEDYLKFYSGNQLLPGNKPLLIILYKVPLS